MAAIEADLPKETIRTWCRKNKTSSRSKYIYSYEDVLPSNISLGPRTVAVDMYDLSGNYIRSFDSIENAGKFLNINTSHIPSVCRGSRVQTGGYK